MKRFIEVLKIGIVTLLATFLGAGAAYAVSTLRVDSLGNTASTTVAFLVPGTAQATSTSPVLDMNGSDSIDLNIQFTASNTPATLNWYYEFSDDNIDWFGEDLAQVSSANTISHSATTTQHSWTPSNLIASTTRKNVSVNPVGSRYMRAVFYANPGATNRGSVWAKFVKKGVK